MRVFEREIRDFLNRCLSVTGGGEVCGVVECISIRGLNVLLCGQKGLAVVLIPLDYFADGGKVEDVMRAGVEAGAPDRVFLYEDRWRGAGPLVRSMLEVRLGLGQRVFARNCGVRRINAETAAAFLERNHIYGPVKAPFRLGLWWPWPCSRRAGEWMTGYRPAGHAYRTNGRDTLRSAVCG